MEPPATPTVRSVLGDIPATALGVCYAHEHIIIDSGFVTRTNPDFLLDSVDAAVAELLEFYGNGGRALIDAMPCDAGRNARKLALVSEASGVHIVCPTGLHLAKYYENGHWGETCSVEKLAGLFIDEIERGIEKNNVGPDSPRRPRAGLIKIAAGKSFTPREEKIFAAAAEAHRLTGAPILTHTEQGELGLEQVEKLVSLGVDLRHVVLSHLDRKPDHIYHRDILDTGVRVEYDSAFRWPEHTGNPTRDLLVGLFSEFPDQIMLGMDAARKTYWKNYGGSPGLSYLLREFTADLRTHGFNDSDLVKIFVHTPADAYSFKTLPPV